MRHHARRRIASIMIGAGILVVPTVAMAQDDGGAAAHPPTATVEEDVLQDQLDLGRPHAERGGQQRLEPAGEHHRAVQRRVPVGRELRRRRRRRCHGGRLRAATRPRPTRRLPRRSPTPISTAGDGGTADAINDATGTNDASGGNTIAAGAADGRQRARPGAISQTHDNTSDNLATATGGNATSSSSAGGATAASSTPDGSQRLRQLDHHPDPGGRRDGQPERGVEQRATTLSSTARSRATRRRRPPSTRPTAVSASATAATDAPSVTGTTRPPRAARRPLTRSPARVARPPAATPPAAPTPRAAATASRLAPPRPATRPR